jgi:hypothetical protein
VDSLKDSTNLTDLTGLKSKPGIEGGLTLVLDMHTNSVSAGTVTDSFQGFKVSVFGQVLNTSFPENIYYRVHWKLA